MKIIPYSSISPTIRSHHTAVVLNPYSVHSGSIRPNRHNTTKSAPSGKTYNRLGNNSPVQRVGSAESILDYHQNRIVKGKSLDLQLQLDNNGFERSCPDVSDETDFNPMSDQTCDSVGRADETSFFQQTKASSTQRNDWAFIIIGGKGKHSADMYKTTVDIWKCDVGNGETCLITVRTFFKETWLVHSAYSPFTGFLQFRCNRYLRRDKIDLSRICCICI